MLRERQNLETTGLYEFGGFRLDAVEGVLTYGSEPVKLTPKALQTLTLLVERGGRIVTKNEFLETVWVDTFVEENALSFNISQLRKILAKYDPETKFIETVPRRGFRFAAPLREVKLIDEVSEIFDEKPQAELLSAEIIEEAAPSVNGIQSSPLSAPPAHNKAGKPIYLVASIIAVLLLTAAFVFYSGFGAAKPVENAPLSLAVLPLQTSETVNGDELRWSMTDALTTNLGESKSFTVRPTATVIKFSKNSTDALETGRKLQVDAILDGRIQSEGDRLRVTLQLILVKDGSQMWARQFDGRRGELLSLQDRIAAELRQNFAPQDSDVKRPTDDDAAFENLLKGRFFAAKRTREGLHKAIGFYEQAVAADPNFAEAYVALADAQFMLFDWNYESSEYVQKAKDSLAQALLIKPDAANALVTLGIIQTSHDWNWRDAENNLARATALAPNSADAHLRYGTFLNRIGRHAEARDQLQKALELDPLSLSINVNLGFAHYCGRNFAEAEKQYQKTLQLDENFAGARYYLARWHWQQGNKPAAFEEYARALAASGYADLSIQIKAKASNSNHAATLRFWIAEWEKDYQSRRVDAHSLAVVAAHLGDKDLTIKWLRKAVDERNAWSSLIKVEPEFEFVRGEPEFNELLRQMNLE